MIAYLSVGTNSFAASIHIKPQHMRGRKRTNSERRQKVFNEKDNAILRVPKLSEYLLLHSRTDHHYDCLFHDTILTSAFSTVFNSFRHWWKSKNRSSVMVMKYLRQLLVKVSLSVNYWNSLQFCLSKLTAPRIKTLRQATGYPKCLKTFVICRFLSSGPIFSGKDQTVDLYHLGSEIT